MILSQVNDLLDLRQCSKGKIKANCNNFKLNQFLEKFDDIIQFQAFN